ncbi:MAG TPA: DUF4082 domain-containing protein [Candidatus Saccharimonadales bacterium]|nr:DUF4082 domain-containing protein [Candidatus Saccharimonadales bacterium]
MNEFGTSYVSDPGGTGGKPTWLGWALVAAAGVIGITLAVVLGMHFLGNKSPKSQAEKPLTVAVASIKQDQVITNDTIVTVDVNDPSRVDHVEYYVDNTFVGVTYALPFDFTLKAKDFTDGSHSVVAKAYDKKGKAYSSKKVTIVVKHEAKAEDTPSEDAADDTAQPSTGTKKPSSSTSSGKSSSGGSTGGNTGGSTTPPDTTAPSAPSNLLLSADDGYTVKVTWNASTDNIGVTGYDVYRDGALAGTVTSAQYTDQTVVPGNTYTYTVKAFDAAGNSTAGGSQPSITLVPTSIWVNGDSAATVDTDPTPLELGTKFKPLVDGKVSGVRFYKASGATGTHVGSLWASGGAQMATVTFSSESASGWQQAVFSSPVSVTAGTTYVISYTAPSGHYGYTAGYFNTDGITSQYLTAPSTGSIGGNGVFTTSAGTFPNSTFGGNNYWVDPLFIPNKDAGGPTATTLDTSTVYAGFPGSNNTGVPLGKRLPVRDRGMTIYENGATVENVQIEGEVDVRAQNVTIKNSKINSIVYLDRDAVGGLSWYLTLEDSTVNAGPVQRGAITLGQVTVRRANIYGGQTSIICSADCNVSDSWLHGQALPAHQTWHLGGFLSNGGSNMQLSHNTISCDTANNIEGGGCSGDLNLYGDFEAIQNITIDGNLFTANQDAGYCLAAGYNASKTYGPGANNVSVINNTFQKGTTGFCAGFGVATDYKIGGTPAPGNVWTNNHYDDGTVVDAPN